MLNVRKGEARGHAQHGWLESRHSFSFADYYDPAFMGYSVLRVINEDRVAPGAGFPSHAHRDMEILTYVLAGALEHQDSMGNGSIIRPGDVQRMSAGTGVTHSEFNASKTEPVHFLQIWLLPARRGVNPSYAQRHFSEAEKHGRLCLIAAPVPTDGALAIQQDAQVFATSLIAGERVSYRLPRGRRAYVHVAQGQLRVNGVVLSAGDGARIADTDTIDLAGVETGEGLLFDLP